MFDSILSPDQRQIEIQDTTSEPSYFHDLNLDRVFDPIIKSTKSFGLESVFYSPLRDIETIRYRQEILRELENSTLFDQISSFSEEINRLSRTMKEIKKALESESGYENNFLTRGRVLNYACQYRELVFSLYVAMNESVFSSKGLRDFRVYLGEYCASTYFAALSNSAKQLQNKLESVQYCMLIHEGTIRVREYEEESDLASEVVRLFEKFRQGDVKDYRGKIREDNFAPHIEAAVLGMLASQKKELFSELYEFSRQYLAFIDETIARFAVEVQFYLAWIKTIREMISKDLKFCYPTFSKQGEQIRFDDSFDIALALTTTDSVVTNNVQLDFPERMIVITGPNQGGKTTFARSFAQIHYLASLGLSVPGSQARLQLFDRILTHFGREEDLSTLNGKLQDDLIRLNELLNMATAESIVIVNEIFTSTTLKDAILLGNRMMERFSSIGSLVICVTFLDELAVFNENTVSMMSTVSDEDHTKRTFKIIRKPPDGLAYAIHIAEKNRATYKQLTERLRV